jgi:hypothetical protein
MTLPGKLRMVAMRSCAVAQAIVGPPGGLAGCSASRASPRSPTLLTRAGENGEFQTFACCSPAAQVPTCRHRTGIGANPCRSRSRIKGSWMSWATTRRPTPRHRSGPAAYLGAPGCLACRAVSWVATSSIGGLETITAIGWGWPQAILPDGQRLCHIAADPNGLGPGKATSSSFRTS